jgi:hypothetical protein
MYQFLLGLFLGLTYQSSFAGIFPDFYYKGKILSWDENQVQMLNPNGKDKFTVPRSVFKKFRLIEGDWVVTGEQIYSITKAKSKSELPFTTLQK